MQELFTGLYVCGSILLTLALLMIVMGLLLGVPTKRVDANRQSWQEIWQARMRRAELEAELEELGKEEQND